MTTDKVAVSQEAREAAYEIEAAFDRYLDLVELVYEDIKAVPELDGQLRALTAKRQAGSMDSGRTFTSEYHDTDV